MPRKPINFELDFMIKDIFPRFTVKQFDDVSFNIKPLNQGLDYDTTGMIGKIFVGVNNDMFMQTTNITVSSNNINVLLDKNMLQKNGRAYAEIELTDEAGTITSSSFIFDIDPKIGEGGMIPGEYEGFVEKYERLISEFKKQVNSSVNNANSLINSTVNNANSLVNETIEKCNTDVDNKLNTVDGLINTKISDIEKRFNNITTSKQQDAEIIDARDGEGSLKARLDRDIEKAKQIYTTVEGSNISVDSADGYMKDIQIIGNTIQDTSNLADIRSVGDKLENQELYEIPVLITGKNLFRGDMQVGHMDLSGNILTTIPTVLITHNAIKIKKNTNYYITNNIHKYLYLKSKNGNTINSSGGSFTFNSGDCDNIYIQVNDVEDGMLDFVNSNIQIEEGTQATPYEPYQEDKLTILSPVQLEKVGDVADRIICKDGVWGVEKNIVRLNTLNFTTATGYGLSINSTHAFGVISDLTINPKSPVISKYEVVANQSGMNYIEKEYISIDSLGRLRFSLQVEKLSKLDTNGFLKAINNEKAVVLVQTTQPQFIPLPHDQQVKLRTFANKTNIHFECEIEGTIKASVPKSLGATVNSHSEQIDNLSKELDRVKKLEESTVSTVVTESDFTTVEETSNGYFEDIKLEGRTLVNLNNVPTTFDEIDGLRYGNCFRVNLKANTDYTFINITDKKFQINGASVGVWFELPAGNIIVKSFESDIDSTQIRLIAHSNFGWTTSDTDKEMLKQGLIVLEGDHTHNPPSYFEGLKSVGQDVDEISVSSVDPNGNLLAFIDTGSNTECSFNGNVMSFIRNGGGTRGIVYFDKLPKGTYTLSFNVAKMPNTANIRFDVFEKIKDLSSFSKLKEWYMPNGFVSFTFTLDASKYIAICTDYSGDNIVLEDLIINKGTTPKPYTPNQSNKKPLLYYNEETQTWEKPILRQWDSIEKHSDGKYYYHKRSGEIVLNGSEDWWIDNQNNGLVCAVLLPSDAMSVNEVTPTKHNGKWHYSVTLTHSLYATAKVNTLEDFINELKANPVTVVYQLAEEKVYECTDLDLITYENETNLVVKSGVLSPKTTLKLKSGVGNVVSMLQRKVTMLEDLVSKLIQNK